MNDYDDLNWVAFQYISGELSSDEVEAFEARLADDQAAREAVAASVQIAQAVALMPEEPAVPRDSEQTQQDTIPQRRQNRLAIVAIAVSAACLLMALSTLFTQPGQNPGVTQANERADQIVDAWASTIPLAEEPVGTVDDADVGKSDLTVPEWMLLAVSEDNGTDSEDDETWEN